MHGPSRRSRYSEGRSRIPARRVTKVISRNQGSITFRWDGAHPRGRVTLGQFSPPRPRCAKAVSIFLPGSAAPRGPRGGQWAGGSTATPFAARHPPPSPRAFAHDARRAASHGVARAGNKAGGRGAQRAARAGGERGAAGGGNTRVRGARAAGGAERERRAQRGPRGGWVRAAERPARSFEAAFGKAGACGAAWRPQRSSTCWTAGAERGKARACGARASGGVGAHHPHPRPGRGWFWRRLDLGPRQRGAMRRGKGEIDHCPCAPGTISAFLLWSTDPDPSLRE